MPNFRPCPALPTMALGVLLVTSGCELISSPDRSVIDQVDADETPLARDAAVLGDNVDTSEMMPMDGSVVAADAGATADAAAAADAAHNADASQADAAAIATNKVIYLTSMPKKANFGGVAGADGLCNANPPVAGSYRALIADGTTRAVGINWALAPNTKYVRADGTTVIGTTNANATFVFPLNASMGTIGVTIWTGLAADWSNSADDCNNWAGTAGFSATTGLADTTDSQAIMGVLENCATLAGSFFACVQQ